MLFGICGGIADHVNCIVKSDYLVEKPTSKNSRWYLLLELS
ncbi:hypothetical protein SAMN05443246_0665 [Paenibacillus sp. GP183]|nr:hypothetical protein SAMN05443246_0665 [Paenibacillus sp. GP183]